LAVISRVRFRFIQSGSAVAGTQSPRSPGRAFPKEEMWSSAITFAEFHLYDLPKGLYLDTAFLCPITIVIKGLPIYIHIRCFHSSSGCSYPWNFAFPPPTSIATMAYQAFPWGDNSLRGPSSPPIRQAEWDQHRELLKHLYLEADMTLEAVMEYMRVHREFTPSYVHPAQPPSGPSTCFSKVMSF
jgi:hypothetical protein